MITSFRYLGFRVFGSFLVVYFLCVLRRTRGHLENVCGRVEGVNGDDIWIFGELLGGVNEVTREPWVMSGREIG